MCEYASRSTAPFDTKGLFLSSLGIIDAPARVNTRWAYFERKFLLSPDVLGDTKRLIEVSPLN